MKNILTKVVITTTMPTALLLTAKSAYGASIFFSPAGSQLDDDPINDVLAKTGGEFALTTKVDTTGLPGNLDSLVLSAVRDSLELTNSKPVQTSESLAALGLETVSPDTSDPAAVLLTVTYGGGGTGLAPNTTLDLTNITYSVSELFNDGLTDFRMLEVKSALTTDGTDVTSLFDVPTSNIEVQASVANIPEPSSILGLLVFGALGARSVFKRKKA